MKPHRILVPVNGEQSDEEAVRLACSLAAKGKAIVYVLNVVEVARKLPLDNPDVSAIQRGEALLDHVEGIGKDEKCQLEAELIQAREVGPAVVDESVERQVDLIIMGIDYKDRKGDHGLGETIPYVLKHAECAVWISRGPNTNGAKKSTNTPS